MSGGVPKRVKISKTQSNTPSKAGRWGKHGVILCSGGTRSQRAMCNYIMRRTNNEKRFMGAPGDGWTLVVDENFISAVKIAHPSVIAKDFEITQGNHQTYFKNSTINTIISLDVNTANISDLTGINGFTALTNLNVASNNLTSLNITTSALTTLNLNNNTSLTSLICTNLNLNTLLMNNISTLKTFNCSKNNLNAISVNSNNNLIDLNCSYNSLTTLTVSNCTALENLNCSNNNISGIFNVTPNIALVTLNCSNNLALTEFNSNNCSVLTTLNVSGNNVVLTDLSCNSCKLTTIDGLETCLQLKNIYCNNNKLITLDTSNLLYLKQFECKSNLLTTLIVSANTEGLYCNDNKLTTLSVINCNYLTILHCQDNNTLTTLEAGPPSGTGSLTTLNVSNNIALKTLGCNNLDLNTIDGLETCTALIELNCESNTITALDLSANLALENLNCKFNNISALDLTNNINLIDLNCSVNPNLTTLDGLSDLTSLKTLSCTDCSLTTLELDGSPYNGGLPLQYLDCHNIPSTSTLTTLIVKVCPDLQSFRCDGNIGLTVLDCARCDELITIYGLETCIALTNLDCHSCSFTALDVSANTALTDLSCSDNLLNTLNVSNCASLEELHCNFNGSGSPQTPFTIAGIADCTQLKHFYSYDSGLSGVVDLSQNTNLERVSFQQSNLLTELYCNNNPLLTYINIVLCDSLDVLDNTGALSLPLSGSGVGIDLNARPNKIWKCSNCPLFSGQLDNIPASLEILECNNCDLSGIILSNSTTPPPSLIILEASGNRLTKVICNTTFSTVNPTASTCQSLDLTQQQPGTVIPFQFCQVWNGDTKTYMDNNFSSSLPPPGTFYVL